MPVRHPREYTDTDPKAMEVWLDLLRKMTPEERFTRGLQLCELATAVSEAGVRAAYPEADEREVFLRTAARRLPRECMIQAYDWIRNSMATLADALAELLTGLDRLEIPYYVGGSVASTFYGIYRTTNDVDLVANIAPEQADELAECIGKDFYIDPATVRSAIARGRAFNVVHLASAYKIDIFPAKRDAYSQAAFSRRAFRELRSLGPEPIECAVATAEDTILAKLEWYRAGGETSERQWNDLRGIRMVSGAILDYEYLRKWAPYLKVDDLLEQLLAE